MVDVLAMQPSDYESVTDRTGFDPGWLRTDHSDRHFVALDHNRQIRARCSVWWRNSPPVNGRVSGIVGHYAACNEDFGMAVLQQACRELGNRGCELAVGPMDGNTWRRYRFVTERGSFRPFFLEPDNPDDYPVHFGRCGFEGLAEYVSEINPAMASRQPELGELRDKMASQRIEIRPLSSADPQADLDGIYDVVSESFKDAFMYTPLERDCYRQLYAPLLEKIDPRLVLVARQDKEVVGFIFSPPDFLQKSYQDRVDAIVIKTIAVLPRKELSGLGRVLIVDLLENALSMGFTTAISALMHVQNRSRKISSRCAAPMRRYTLFAKELKR